MLLDDLSRAVRAKQIELDPFTYTAIYPIGVFIGAANIPVNIPIQADSDFVITKSVLVSYTAAGTFLVNPDYTIAFFDSGSGRQLQDNPVHVHNIMGSAERPYIWPEPKLIKGSSTFVVTLLNRTGVAAAVDCAFLGFKIFYLKNFSRESLGVL